jgi:probable blue pigment (indigoidine) exporter
VEDKWRWMLVTAVAPLAWGAGYLVTGALLPPDAPLWGAFLRAAPAAIVLLLLARRLPHGAWWWRSVVLGALNIGVFFVLVYLAAQHLPSSISTVIAATSSAGMLLLGWAILDERPRALGIIGAALGIGGTAAMVLAGAGAPDPLGIAASIGSVLCASTGAVLARRWRGQVPPLASTSWQLAVGALLVLPAALLVEGPPPALDGGALLGFAALSLIGTALAFVCWFAGLARLPAGTVGLLGLLNPVSGVLLGVLVAGERLGPLQLGGLVLVLLGIVVGLDRRRGRADALRAGGPPRPRSWRRRAPGRADGAPTAGASRTPR